MDFISEDIANYAEKYSSPESAVLYALNRRTHLTVSKPRMLSGHLQGNLLSTFAKLIQPSKVLEIGTYTSYSAIALATGLSENGTLDSIDNNEELYEMNSNTIKEAGLSHKIKLHIGDAKAVIALLQGQFKSSECWDMVFIDADKNNYALYYDLVIDYVRKGGLIIADNVLWSGKVLNDKVTDKDTQALKAFNEKILNDNRVYNTLLPVRDGLMLIYKL